MAIRNYRQAKRFREDSRKKRQQEKLERKQNRGAASPPVTEPSAPPAEIEPKDSP
jgi:hypothetical protein